jgi:2-phosphosulfolactate phosphatase
VNAPFPSTPSLWSDQHGFDGRFEWGQDGVRLLAGQVDVVVIVDVLSFSTAVSVAVDRGASVIPFGVHDDTAAEHARSLAATLATRDRRGPGPSLSPASLSVLRAGERLVLRSPNGATCSLLAAESGALVVAGCLRNASAVARFAAARGSRIAVIAAGELWPGGALRPAVEDLVGAGAVLAALHGRSLSPEATAAVAAFRAARTDLRSMLRSSASGRELIAQGYTDDVEIAGHADVSDRVPVLTDGAFG